MGKKLTQEEFIVRAKEIHGDKYDYSKVEYTKSRNKVCIICIKHGEFWQTANEHLGGKGCAKCGNERKGSNNRGNRETFITKSNEFHKGKYDYSKVVYINSNTSVCIICPIHGEFWQKPINHTQGKGCPKCGLIHRNTKRSGQCDTIKAYGVGVNDVYEKVYETEYYKKWLSILYRCYHPTQKEHSKSYNDCKVCDEWHYLSNFKKWFEDTNNGFIKGYEIDKDLLSNGNKIYSPSTCCFLPPEINGAIKLSNGKKKLPTGVIEIVGRAKNYRVDFRKKSVGYFETIEEANNYYKKLKKEQILELANKYYKDCLITNRVYNGLINFVKKNYE